MNGEEAILMIFLPIALIGAAAAGIGTWRHNGGAPRALVASRLGGGVRLRSRSTLVLVMLWLLLTGMSLWLVALGCLVGVHLLLFWLGSAAAWVGLAATIAAIVAVPAVWVWALFR